MRHLRLLSDHKREDLGTRNGGDLRRRLGDIQSRHLPALKATSRELVRCRKQLLVWFWIAMLLAAILAGLACVWLGQHWGG